ncbi:MAG: hypothetical protein ABJN42_22540 [Roseibium sp.]|uniref:hypothetical protein n=1 Tax=Roseibium sp. TaxID=1936156 RepID=UPI00329804BD
MGLKTFTVLAVGAIGVWFAADHYGISLDPRDHLPTDTLCYVQEDVLHIEQVSSLNMDRAPRMTKNVRMERDRGRFYVSDSYGPDGAGFRDIELLLITPRTIEIDVRPGALKNIQYVFRSPEPNCAQVIRDYFALTPSVLPQIVD